jgi:sugar lactone lactonase YvrE
MTYQRGEVMTKTGLYAAIIALPYTVSANKYRRPLKKAPSAAALLLLAACFLIPLSCSHPVNVGGDGGDGNESMVTITLPGAERSASRSAITGATIAQLEFQLTLTKGSTVKTAVAPPGKPTLKVPLAEGEWQAAAEAYLPAGHVHVGTGSTKVKVGPGQPNKVIITMVFDNTMPAAVTADYMGQTYTADYAGNAIYTVALNSYDPAQAVQINVSKALAEQDITITNNNLATSAYVSEPKQETLLRGTGPAFSVGAGSGFTTNYTVNLVYPGGYVITFAGSGTAGSADGPAALAQFNSPSGVAMDGAGNVYVLELLGHRIRKITPAGVVTTLAGDGTTGSSNGTGTAAQFNHPKGIAVDSTGNLYVADTANSRIRKIVIATGVVSTLAGNTAGFADGTSAAQFNSPYDVATDSVGNLYVADYNNNSIRKIDSSGYVSTLAGSTASGTADGTGTAARFYHPSGVAADGAGNLYVADQDNSRIRKIVIATQEVTTLAGSSAGYADGTGTAAQFQNPTGVAVDGAGNLYVADSTNHRIRRIVIATGVVSTLTGSGTMGGFTDGTLTAAQFSLPQGVTVDGAGNLYVADQSNYRIRKIVP